MRVFSFFSAIITSFLLLVFSVNATPDQTECHLPKIAFLILVHNRDTLDGCGRLIDALYHEDHTFYVHFDTKMPVEDFSYEWRVMSFGRKQNMRKLNMHSLSWGSWEMLAPWFSVAELLTSGVETRQWDYFINLSGDAWPVLRPEPLRRALGRVSPFNFVACSSTVTGLRPNAWHEFDPGWHKRKAFPYPIVEGTSAEAYYGSQWMVVSAAFVRFVIAELLDSRSFTAQLADWFAHGTLVIDTGRENLRVRPHIPDEIFFPTVLMNAPSFNGSIGASTVPPPRLEGLRDMTYIRMDEHYPWSNFNQRYASPENASSRPWGPYYLGTYDLANIKRSGALFLRKVSSQVDENLLRILPADSHSDIPNIGWPAQLSPKVAQDSILTEPELKTPGGEPIAPPAPAPVPELPFISVLERGPVGHVDERGCVAVAESIHCPPQHPIDPEEVKKHGLPVGVGFGG